MSTPSTAVRSPSTSSARPDKTKRPSNIVTLTLSAQLLSRFEDESRKKEKSTPSSASSPAPTPNEIPMLKVIDSNDNGSEANSTPAPTQGASTPADPPKKRKGPLPGYKRGSNLGPDGQPKPRGKPGPKKKPRLEDGTIDHNAKTSVGAVAGVGGHKLGPKANQGAINAGLRALDRSGKPCRKWMRKPFHLKSFTGVIWEIPSWKGNEKSASLNSEELSDMRDVSQQSSSDLKPTESDTAMDSNAGDQADPMVLSTPAASSPAPTPLPSSAILAQG